MNKRFKDDSDIYVFTKTFLVECPKCGACATVTDMSEGEKAALFGEKRFVCTNCGASKTKKFTLFKIHHDGYEWYFGYPLYLKVPCCGQTLWAMNEDHLDFLQKYAEAKLREEGTQHTLANRLPKWIKDAKNRDEILRCLKKLREKLKNK